MSYIYITLIYITPRKKKYGPITRMRTSIVFMIIIILVIKSANQKLLSSHVNENFYLLCDYYYLCHNYITLIYITPDKRNMVISREWELLSFLRLLLSLPNILYYHTHLHEPQPKNMVLSHEWELLSSLWLLLSLS